MDLIERAKLLKGTIGFYYKDINSGEIIAYNEKKEFIPASIIKLPVFMAICKMASQGRADLKEKIKITYDLRVPSCGAFNAFTDEPVVDIKTLCNLMIVISDNTAANVLIHHFGIENLNREFKKMGLTNTRIERLFYDDEMQEKGYNNKAVPEEIGMLLESIYRKEFVNKEVSDYILSVLLNQQHRDLIPTYIEEFCQVGNKTGEARGISGDVALILGEHPFILVIIANEAFVPEVNDFIRISGKDLFEKNRRL